MRFLLRMEKSDHIVVNREESNQLLWIGKNKNDLPTDDWSVVRMFHKWINGEKNETIAHH